MALNSTDRKILNILQTNARISNAELSEQINLSPSACLRRVRQLEFASGLHARWPEDTPVQHGLSVVAVLVAHADTACQFMTQRMLECLYQ